MSKAPMHARYRLYLLILLNGLTTVVAALNLSANVFVLKATRWTAVQVWSLDFPQLWLYYSPLLFPMWFWTLLQATGRIGPRVRLREIPRELIRSIPRGLRPWLLAAVGLALLSGFPFAHVDLGDAPRPDTGVLLRHYWQTMVIAGIARPGAIFFFAAGLWVFVKAGRRPTESSANSNANGESITNANLNMKAGRFLFAALAAAILLRIVLAGPAIPRLEDEVAYHVQALIFEAGRARGELSGALAATGIAAARLEEILQLPYIFFDVAAAQADQALPGPGAKTALESPPLARYFSAHFHGWSALLATLSSVALKPYANALFMILNCGLFALLLRRAAPAEFHGEHGIARVFALFLFVCAPATLILTGTYMSHVATQSLLLLLFLAHSEIRAGDSVASDSLASGSGRTRAFVKASTYGLAIAAVLTGLAFVRLQAAAPALIALLLADLILIGVNLRAKDASAGTQTPTDPRYSSSSALLRLGLLAIGTMIALFAYDLYARSLGADDWFFTRGYLHRYFEVGCQAIGWGPGHGCFPTYGSLGHSFQKFLLNGFDRVSELNHELSPAGLPLLPIALLLAIRHWRRLLDPRQVWLKFTLAFLGATGVYSLYFHNGGESYRGRYVFEAVFAFYLIFAKLATLELQAWFSSGASSEAAWRANFARVLLILTPAILVTNAAFTIRGDYFSRFIQPYANVNAFAAPTEELRIENTLIGTRDLVEQLGERDPESGDFYYPLEFEAGERAALPLASMKAFLNLGYPSLAATAVRLDEFGLLRDANDNALIGAANPQEMRKLAAFLRIQTTRRLEYRLPETNRIRRGLVRWILHPPALKPIDAAPESP